MEKNFNTTPIKPSLSQPTTMGKQVDSNFKKEIRKSGMNIKETAVLNEKEAQEKGKSLKKRIFKLDKMETLVHTDEMLSSKFEELKGEDPTDKWGYHWNEVILNLLFNRYILNSPKYLNKYKNTHAAQKTRRGEEGIAQLQHDIEKDKTASATADKRVKGMMSGEDGEYETGKEEVNELFGIGGGSPTQPLPMNQRSKNDTYFVDLAKNKLIDVVPFKATPEQKQQIIQKYVSNPNFKQISWYDAATRGIQGVPTEVPDGNLQQMKQELSQQTSQGRMRYALGENGEQVQVPNDARSMLVGSAWSVAQEIEPELPSLYHERDVEQKVEEYFTNHQLDFKKLADPKFWEDILHFVNSIKDKKEGAVSETTGAAGGSGAFSTALDQQDKMYQNETTTSSSSGQYSGIGIWAANPKKSRFAHKPAYAGGKILEKVKEPGMNYLHESNAYKGYLVEHMLVQLLNEQFDSIKEGLSFQDQARATFEKVKQMGIENPSLASEPGYQDVLEIAKYEAETGQVHPVRAPQKAVTQTVQPQGDSNNQWKQPVAPMKETELEEHHLHSKEDKVDFILQHSYDDASDSATYSEEQLMAMPDEEIEHLYREIEKSIGLDENNVGQLSAYKNKLINSLRNVKFGQQIINALGNVYDQVLVNSMNKGIPAEELAQKIMAHFGGEQVAFESTGFNKNFVDSMKTDLADTRSNPAAVNKMSPTELEDKENLFKGGAINERAESKKQQRFMGMVDAAQKGELKNPSPAVAKAAKEMKHSDVHDFAATKHKGLPEKVKKKKKVDEGMFGLGNQPSAELNVDQLKNMIDQFRQSPESQQLRDQFVKAKDYIKSKAGQVGRLPQLKMWLDQNMPQLSNYVSTLWSNWDLLPTSQLSESGMDKNKYKEFVKSELKASGKSLKDMSPEEKKEYFKIMDGKFKSHLEESMIDNQPDSMINNQGDSMVNSMNSDELNTDGSSPEGGSPQGNGVSGISPAMEDETMKETLETTPEPYMQEPEANSTNRNQPLDLPIPGEGDDEESEFGDEKIKSVYRPDINGKVLINHPIPPRQEKELTDQKAKLMSMFGVDSFDQLNYKQKQEYRNSLGIKQPTPVNALSGNIGETKLKETKKEMKENLKEERKVPAILNVEKLGAENAKNFKSDMAKEDGIEQQKTYPHRDTIQKAVMWPKPEDFYIRQDVDQVQKDAKTMADIEAEALAKHKNALENVGNATANGKDIPKRNLTKEEMYELAMNRGNGMQDIVYDTEPSEKFEDRMKKDMGDNVYKSRQQKMEYKAGAPMYNKDTQPTENGEKKVQDDKFIKGYNLQEAFTAKYRDVLGKLKLVEFKLEDVEAVQTINENAIKLSMDGLGNKYSNIVKERAVNKKVNENAEFKITDKYDFYLNEDKVQAIEKGKVVVETKVTVKNSLNENFGKMKHLMNYNKKNYVDTTKSVKF